MRKIRIGFSVGGALAAAVAVVALTGVTAHGQNRASASTGQGNGPMVRSEATPQAGSVTVPQSSQDQGEGRAHTNYVLLNAKADGSSMLAGPLVDGNPAISLLETPRSLGCLYLGSPKYVGCAPNGFSDLGGPSPTGSLATSAIAIVDAFDNPNAANDLKIFTTQFHLTPAAFTKIYANGNGDCGVPPFDAGWSLEEDLDIEWAHVFSPKAHIILVEACSNSYTDLFYAEQVAFSYLVTHYPAGGEVSNSWQGGEPGGCCGGQDGNDLLFTDHIYNAGQGYVPNVLALASSGDGGIISGQAGYPSANPWVLTAGGTTINRDASTHAFVSESCWGGAGGGISSNETWHDFFGLGGFTGGHTGPWADYQYPIFGPTNRATPDMSFDADPASGVPVYSGVNGGWWQVGGTSLASPALASILNRADNFMGTVHINGINGSAYFNTAEHDLVYSELQAKAAYKANFYDVTTGSNGTSATTGWDYCTGVGSPRGVLGK